MEADIQSQKMAKAYKILSKGDKPKQLDYRTFTVPSQSGNWYYTIKKKGEEWCCDCPDHNKRDADCKHIYTVKFWLNLRDSLKEDIEDSKPLNFTPCPKCGSYDAVKMGFKDTKNGKKQRFLCKDCGRTFMLKENGFQDMKFDSEIVVQCLDLYFKGLSLRKVSDHIKQMYGVDVHFTTIMRWIGRYSKIISEYVETLEPQLGDVWCADEMLIKVKHDGITRFKNVDTQWVWLWNIMDNKTRFLISNMVTKKKGVKEARKIFQDAKKKAGKPKYIVSDGLSVYPRAFNKVFYDHHQSCKHISEVGLRDRINNNRVERLHGTIREREKVMRALFNPQTSDKLMDGYRVYYNFVKPHMALDGKTPSEMAGIDLNLGDNKWKGLIEKASKINDLN